MMIRLIRKVKGISASGINKFIRKAALNQDPIFDSYEKLCKYRGNMDYVDFEWKYYQFYHGNRDLTIERSPDNSSPVTFSDLPMDVLEKVVGELNLVDRLVFRKVSTDLRKLVDSTEVHCEKISFHIGDYYSNIKTGSLYLGYETPDGNGCTVDSNWRNQKYKDDRTFREVMTSDASTFLKNPKLKIDTFVITVDSDEAVSEFVLLLKSLNVQLNVQSAIFRTNFKRIRFDTGNEFIISILPFLKPTTLERIEFNIGSDTKDHINQIAETEQWKRAKKLSCSGFAHMANFLHFKELDVKGFDFTEKNVIMIRDVLLKSPHLERCSLLYMDWTDILTVVQRIDRIMGQSPAYDAKTRRFSIPNSRDHFQLSFENQGINFVFVVLTINRVLGT